MHKELIYNRHKFVALFISLLLMIIVSPFFLKCLYGELMVNGLSFIIIGTALYSVRNSQKQFIGLCSLAAAILIVTLLKANYFSVPYQLMDLIFSFCFYCWVAMLIIHLVLNKDEITRDLIFAALSAYLLIGVAFGTLYELINFIAPQSFIYDNAYNSGIVHQYDLVYFSFTTLSTVGFGDIIAVKAQARSVVILEAVTGVFYLAVLVARLVGSMAQRKKKES